MTRRVAASWSRGSIMYSRKTLVKRLGFSRGKCVIVVYQQKVLLRMTVLIWYAFINHPTFVCRKVVRNAVLRNILWIMYCFAMKLVLLRMTVLILYSFVNHPTFDCFSLL